MPISFVDGIVAANVRIWTDSSGNLNLSHTGTNNIIVVNGGSMSANGVILGGTIDSIVIGATTWNLAASFTQHGTDGMDTIYALASGGSIYGNGGTDYLMGGAAKDLLYGGDDIDQIYGYAGNDVLDGGSGDDYLVGGTGHDVYFVGSGDTAAEDGTADNDLYLITATATGNYTISETGGSTDALYVTLLSGQTYSFVQNGSDLNIVLTQGTNTSTITLSYQYDLGSSYLVERIIFGSFAGNTSAWTGSYSHTGGFTMTTTGLRQTITGTSSGETLYGSDTDLITDTINAGAGNDTVYGYGGRDTLNGDDGADTIYGGANNDTIHGNAGNDILYGDAGTDALYGDAGADTFMFGTSSTSMDTIHDYSTANGDIINLADIIGYSSSLGHAIANFVQLTTVSGSHRVQVDRDGTGSTYGWENVAQLQGVTGLNVSTLIANGSLIVE